MAVSRRLRFSVLQRDAFTCRYCGASAPDVKLQVDHVVPVALGGSDDPTNLVTACADCNAGKTSTGAGEEVVAQVADDAARFAAALEHIASQQAAARDDWNDKLGSFQGCWYVVTYNAPMDRGWENNVRTFLEVGLTMADLEHYAAVAGAAPNVTSRNVFRYFAGCCWAEVRRRQERAAEMLREDDQ